MLPIDMLSSLFPTNREILISRLSGNSETVQSAADFGPAVILGAARRDTAWLTTANVSDSTLTRFGLYTQTGGTATEAANLKKVSAFWGPISQEDKVHVTARSGQSVTVGDGSVVEASGVGRVLAGDDATILGGDLGNSIFMGDRSVARGGDSVDYITGGDNAAARGGEGGDVISLGDGAVASGDDGADSLTVGALSMADGGDGDDTIQAGAGGQILGGAGDDSISVTLETDQTATTSRSTVEGGSGDDVIIIDGTNADITFNAGDGSDVVGGDLAGSSLTFADYLATGAQVARDSSTYSTAGQYDLVFTFTGSTDTVRVLRADQNTGLTISFAGGTTFTAADF